MAKQVIIFGTKFALGMLLIFALSFAFGVVAGDIVNDIMPTNKMKTL